MSAPPLPTFIPQDAWYSLTTGGVNPSEAASVPNVTYLRPSSTPQGGIDGLIGSLDGALVYLAGTNTELDGGQKWLMWIAGSMAPDDGGTVFNPHTDLTKPGRWVSTGPNSANPLTSAQRITAGGVKSIASSTTPKNDVFIRGRSTSGATTLNLPGTTFAGQTFTIFTDSDTDTNHVTVQTGINGMASDTLTSPYQSRAYTWTGTSWAIS